MSLRHSTDLRLGEVEVSDLTRMIGKFLFLKNTLPLCYLRKKDTSFNADHFRTFIFNLVYEIFSNLNK